jgi:hypothetical protein
VSRQASISAPSQIGPAGEGEQAAGARLRCAQELQLLGLAGDFLRQVWLGVTPGFVLMAGVAPAVALGGLDAVLLQRDGGAAEMLGDSVDPLFIQCAVVVVDAGFVAGFFQPAVDVVAPGFAELVQRGFVLQGAVLSCRSRYGPSAAAAW